MYEYKLQSANTQATDQHAETANTCVARWAQVVHDTDLSLCAVLVGSVKLLQMDREGMEDRVYR
jgi:hypothetical protein